LADVKPEKISRLFFIDNIRVYLTILVLLHHLMIIYAGTGNWIYMEGNPGVVVNALGGWFCATDQAYFMELFLLISAYFIPGSYDRKGAGRFLKDRLIRLGIPLVVYCWIINPLFWWVYKYRDIMPFWRFFPREYFSGGQVLGQGPLWFVETLLIFSLVYVLWRVATRSSKVKTKKESQFPRTGVIILFALLLGLAGFLVRLFWVMDVDSFGLLNLQLPFFAQYIALFIIGLMAYRNNWFLKLTDTTGRRWLITALVLIILWAPMMLVNGAIDGDISYRGGLSWQSLVHTLWESFLCVSMCIGLIYAFRRYLNRRGKLAGFLIPNAYTAYLIHAPIITFLAIAVQGITLYPLLKWAVVAIVAIPVCFGLSYLIRKIPYTDRVL
jgi:glucans biosynthesis protein C